MQCLTASRFRCIIPTPSPSLAETLFATTTKPLTSTATDKVAVAPVGPPNQRWKRAATICALSLLAPIVLYVSMSIDGAWPVIFVALVPWLLLVLTTQRMAPMIGYLALFPGFYAMHREVGNVFAAYPALCLVPFVPAIVGGGYALRVLAKRTALPLTLMVGLLWSAGELVRNTQIVPGWHRLATALHAQLWALQVCDLFGMAALSFAIACSSGAVAALILRRYWPDSRPRHASARSELLAVTAVWIVVASYGAYRLHEGKRTIIQGPRVMVVQSDDFNDREVFPTQSSGIRGLFATTSSALRSAAPSERPALIAWPESVLDGTISPEFTEVPATDAMAQRLLRAEQISHDSATDRSRIALAQTQGRAQRQAVTSMVRSFGVPLIVGGGASTVRRGQWQRMNSAFLIEPGQDVPTARHDKMTLFFGYEWLPWSESSVGALRAAHQWLLRAHNAQPQWPPWIAAGDSPTLFSVEGARFAVPICFETEWPDFAFYPSISGENKPDFWLQIANDWWGNHSDDVLRSVRFNIFRAVEARVTVARSGNGGFTGFVAPTGEVYGVVGGPRMARMPGVGRPELPWIARYKALNEELQERLSTQAQRANNTVATQQQIDSLSEQLRSLRRQIRQLLLRSRTTGASIEHVRIDRRRSPYARMKGASDTVLQAGFWLALLAAWRLERRSRSKPSDSKDSRQTDDPQGV